VMVLELFNYIAHYGLVRSRDADGRLESLEDRHSWNSSNVLANSLIFNMGRHSHHHRQPAASYQNLKVRPAPELPFGYAASILLALAPPLWRRTMDGRVLAWRQ
jgi:alkane 1-monooxygenase